MEADLSLALPDCEELNEVEQFCKNCETELHSSEPDVIQDICPHFIRASVLRRVLYYAGGGNGWAVPPAPNNIRQTPKYNECDASGGKNKIMFSKNIN